MNAEKTIACPVCVNTYNRTSRKKIQCNACDHECCMGCYKRYITESHSEPNCMQCHVVWDIHFIRQNFTNSFITTDLKKHYCQLLFDKEKQLFQDTMIDLEERKRVRELHRVIAMLEEQRKHIIMEIRTKRREVNMARQTSAEYIRPCPLHGCNGYLDEFWKCAVCERNICGECHHEVIDEDTHECHPDDVATVTMLESESKPCPKCGIRIQRIIGCNQMFCTQCHVRFDWTSLRIITGGAYHNPHHQAWLMDKGRSRGDIMCGGVPQYGYVRNTLAGLGFGMGSRWCSSARNVVDDILYIERNVIPQWVWKSQPPNNAELRMDFLEKKIDEASFKATLYKRDRKTEIAVKTLHVYEFWALAGADIIRRLIGEKDAKKVSGYFTVEYERLIEECNGLFYTLFEDYKIYTRPIEFDETTHKVLNMRSRM